MTKKNKKVDQYANLLSLYEDPTVTGSLGGVTRFAKARKSPVAKVCKKLEADVGYTLDKPMRRRFRTLPVLVFAIDEQWVADLIEVGMLRKIIVRHGRFAYMLLWSRSFVYIQLVCVTVTEQYILVVYVCCCKYLYIVMILYLVRLKSSTIFRRKIYITNRCSF